MAKDVAAPVVFPDPDHGFSTVLGSSITPETHAARQARRDFNVRVLARNKETQLVLEKTLVSYNVDRLRQLISLDAAHVQGIARFDLMTQLFPHGTFLDKANELADQLIEIGQMVIDGRKSFHEITHDNNTLKVMTETLIHRAIVSNWHQGGCPLLRYTCDRVSLISMIFCMLTAGDDSLILRRGLNQPALTLSRRNDDGSRFCPLDHIVKVEI